MTVLKGNGQKYEDHGYGDETFSDCGYSGQLGRSSYTNDGRRDAGCQDHWEKEYSPEAIERRFNERRTNRVKYPARRHGSILP